MPLVVENGRVARVGATAELFSKYPRLQESARAFRAKTPVTVEPARLLYVQQREFAATTPSDSSVTVIGSADATTCHLVVVRHTGSGAACLAHCDGSDTWAEVPLIIKAVTSLSSTAKNGRLELHLVGGFDDESRTSHKLSLNLLVHKLCNGFSFTPFVELNDVVVDGVHRPVVYGLGVNVKTGEVFPASFLVHGPAEDLRSARTFTGGQMVSVYDPSKEHVKIGPCRWSPNRDMAFWLSQDDETILQYLSTSPMAEPPHFVQHIKSTIQFLLDHPTADSLFPAGEPQVFHRSPRGDWERVDQQ
uniref:Protein N-terminal asparagine amidohydrolase n=1 Tax=Denticeps clupeoides TaxID=299321 RepID=A0AAY4A008_9TELE